jgi:hypothetical protein
MAEKRRQVVTQIDEFNSLHADLIGARSARPNFTAVERFGYDQAEVAIMIRQIRRPRPSDILMYRSRVPRTFTPVRSIVQQNTERK